MTTVNKWYFAKSGETVGPFDIEKAISFVKKNAEHYGWHPKYRSWQPVSMIAEFSDVDVNQNRLSKVPDSLVTEFHDKVASLKQALKDIRKGVHNTESLQAKLKQKITVYKNMTTDLNSDVKKAIEDSEKAYAAFAKKIDKLTQAASVAEQEIVETEAHFMKQIENRASGKTSNKQTSKAKKQSTFDASMVSNTREAELALHALDSDIDIKEDTLHDIETIVIDDEDLLANGESQSLEDLEKALANEVGLKKPTPANTSSYNDNHKIEQSAAIEVENTSTTTQNSVTETKLEADAVPAKASSKIKLKSEMKKLSAVTSGVLKSVFKSDEEMPKLSSALQALDSGQSEDRELETVVEAADDPVVSGKPRRRRRRR